MGQHIIYLTTKNHTSLGDFFRAQYNEFRQWCVDEAEFAESLSFEAQDFLLENKQLPSYEKMERDVLDNLVIHFVNIYCGIIHTNLLVNRNPSMKVDHYMEAKTAIENQCSPQTLKMWKYLLTGRTLFDGSEISVSETGSRLGYWTVQEQIILRKELTDVFGKISEINGIKFVQQVLEDISMDKTELIILTTQP